MKKGRTTWGYCHWTLSVKWVSDMVEMPLEEQPPASAWLPLPDEEGKDNMGLLSLDSV